MKEYLTFRFPEDFLIGTANSAFQSEGAWDRDGKSESNMDYYARQVAGKPRGKTSFYTKDLPDRGCFFYDNYEAYIEDMAKTGQNVYRLSLAWPRIIPTGVGEVNPKGIEFYNKVINKLLDKIPGFDKLEIDGEGMKTKFGLLGEPLFLGVLVGAGIGALSCESGKELVDKIPYVLGLGIKMGAVMELIPRITSLFIEGLKPISDATRELIAKKFKGAAGLNIGMSPALVIGHPATLVVSLLLIPVTLALAVILPGNEFLPLASLAGMFYVFPLILPITKGNRPLFGWICTASYLSLFFFKCFIHFFWCEQNNRNYYLYN